MSQVFTEYVRSLDPSGEPPDSESFGEVWAALGRALVSELKKRGLWSSPPSYLGVFGYDDWRQAPSGNELPGGEALKELLAGCYTHIFIRRLRGLKAQLKSKPNIEGLVYLNIRNFLHDTQKRHDPFGFRIFDVVQRASQDALRDGELVHLAGDRRLRNDTILGFDAEADPNQLPGEELDAVVRSWNDLLLPDLITARGKALERVIAVLRSLVSGLNNHGVRAFSFKQLIEPLKHDARARWCALLAAEDGPVTIEGDGELHTLVRLVQPDTRVEDLDSFEKLTDCLAESLEQVDEGPARTQYYLSRLWEYLHTFALAGDGLPSARKLARHLGIPRERLPGLFEILRGLAEDCGAANPGKSPVSSLVEGHAVSEEGQTGPQPSASTYAERKEGVLSNSPSLQERLRRQTGEASRWCAAVDAEIDRRRDQPPEPGDLFLLAENAEHPVEWAIVDRDPVDPRRLLAVPADIQPLTGSADVTVDRGAASDRLSLRCTYGVWLDAEALDLELRTGFLEPETVELARQKRRDLERGAMTGSVRERRTDGEAEYRQWFEVLEQARAAAPERPAGRERQSAEQSSGKVVPLRRRWHSMSGPLAIAASVLLAVNVGFLALRQPSDENRQPDRDTVVTTLSDELARLEQEQQRLEESHRQDLARLQAEKQQTEAEHKQQIAEIEASTRPTAVANLPLIIVAAGQLRGEGLEIEVAPEARYLMLILQVDDLSVYSRYRLEIQEKANQRLVWRDSGLEASGLAELTVLLPRSMMPDGQYELRLSGLLGDRSEQLMERALTLETRSL